MAHMWRISGTLPVSPEHAIGFLCETRGTGDSQALKFRLSSCCVSSAYTSYINTKICTQGDLKGQTVLILLVLGVENENRGTSYCLPLVSLRAVEKSKEDNPDTQLLIISHTIIPFGGYTAFYLESHHALVNSKVFTNLPNLALKLF